MASDRFSSLPTELLHEILGLLDSPRDLLWVLSASPRVYATFKTYKRQILLQVARNGFRLTALSAAVTHVRFE